LSFWTLSSLYIYILCAVVHKLLTSGVRIIFFFLAPSHVGLAANSASDTAAKAALLNPVSNLTLPHCDYHPRIRSHGLKKLQASWSLETLNKLHAVKPTVNLTKVYCMPSTSVRNNNALIPNWTYLHDTRLSLEE